MGFSLVRILEAISIPGDLLDPGIEPGLPALQADSLPSESPGKSIREEAVPFGGLGVGKEELKQVEC